MSDITIDDFPRDGLVYIAKWRTDPEVNQFLRPGLRTVEEVQAWYETYFSREEHKLFALYDKDHIIGYGTLAHSRPSGGPLKHPPSLRDRIVARLIHRYPV